jgi:hypothetical protein
VQQLRAVSDTLSAPNRTSFITLDGWGDADDVTPSSEAEEKRGKRPINEQLDLNLVQWPQVGFCSSHYKRIGSY